jgi:two-component sensor histidine kinase
MSDNTFQMTREELQAVHEKFREVKHNINNTLAVVMALSELAQRNPAHYEKLAKAVLQRGPDVVQQMQEFQNMLTAKLKGEDAPPPASTPTSGVF